VIGSTRLKRRSTFGIRLGGEGVFSRAIVLVSGDMASANNALRGSASDAVPNLNWLHGSFPEGDIFRIYGNHCLIAEDHLTLKNSASGVASILPHGRAVAVPLDGPSVTNDMDTSTTEMSTKAAAVDAGPEDRPSPAPKPSIPPGLTKQERAAIYAKMKFEKRPKPSKLSTQDKQWRHQNPVQASLADRMKALQLESEKEGVSLKPKSNSSGNKVVIGAVHGIPASHNQGLQKIARTDYFEALEGVCKAPIDILVTHSNPLLPGQENEVKGDDAPRILECYKRSSAYLLVHGHMHTDPVVSVLEDGKVVVNADCRVVAFAPSKSDN